MRAHSLPLVVGLAVLAGCGNYSPEDLRFLAAAPRAIDVALQPPGVEVDEDAAAATNGTGQVTQAMTACEGGLRCEAQGVAMTFNAITAMFTQLIDNILKEPPSRRPRDRRIWGPIYLANEDASFRFEIQRLPAEDVEAEHPFRFCLHFARGEVRGRLEDPVNCDVDVDEESGLTQLFYGGLTPGEESTAQAASGAGRMIFDGNRAIEFGTDGDGIPATLDIRYDHFGEQQLIDIDITDVKAEDSDDGFTAAQYHYLRRSDGGGDFSFQVKADVNPGATIFGGAPELETFEILAVWQDDRAGAARAAVYGGDLPEDPNTGDQVRWDVKECWDRALDVVFYEHPEETDVGDEDDCLLPVPAQVL